MQPHGQTVRVLSHGHPPETNEMLLIQLDIAVDQSLAQNKHCDVRKDTLRTSPAQNRTQPFTNGE
jgi:hypothetical protein